MKSIVSADPIWAPRGEGQRPKLDLDWGKKLICSGGVGEDTTKPQKPLNHSQEVAALKQPHSLYETQSRALSLQNRKQNNLNKMISPFTTQDVS